jgi:hypothetical protein
MSAYLDDGTYPRSQKVSREEMDKLNLHYQNACPDWSYTLSRRK